MGKIKNFILDFGDVLYEIDKTNAVKGFMNLSKGNFSRKEFELKLLSSDSLYTKFEKGELDSNEFRKAMRKEFVLVCNNYEFDLAWNSILVGLFNDSLEIVKRLKTLGNVVLLSNTNPIHYKYFSEQCP